MTERPIDQFAEQASPFYRPKPAKRKPEDKPISADDIRKALARDRKQFPQWLLQVASRIPSVSVLDEADVVHNELFHRVAQIIRRTKFACIAVGAEFTCKGISGVLRKRDEGSALDSNLKVVDIGSFEIVERMDD